jgi:hypothetical protein
MRWLSLSVLCLAAAWAVPGRAQQPQAGPTIDVQFARSRVIRDSALARLIRTNQDFHLLAQGELADRRIDIPPWLRVYFRKQHPDWKPHPQDPKHGYPLYLENVHQWMVTHQHLQAAPPAPVGRRAAVMTGPNVRISGVQNEPRSESDIRMNFANPNLIIAASNAINGDGRQAQFYSTDGGDSWNQTSLPLVEADQFQSDPTVDWTSDGTAWATTMGIQGSVNRLRCYKSTDQGATWTFDSIISGIQKRVDKQMLWVDHSPDSPYRDTIYVIWHNDAPAYINRRAGPAGSWQTPTQVSGAETTGVAIGSDITTNSKGDVFGLWPDTGSRKLFVTKSTDGGLSFQPPVRVADTFASYDIGIPAFASRRALVYVSTGAYRNQNKDLVYAVWTDLNGAGDEPGTNVDSDSKTRIWFARSTDGGATWAEPKKMLNDLSSKNDQFNPRLAVDPATGILAVTYDDTAENTDRKKTNVWYQTSLDDGVNWSAAAKLTTSTTDETAPGADSGNQYGDYNGLTGYNGKFFACWTDRRNGGFEEIFAASISVGPVDLAAFPVPVRRAATVGISRVTDKAVERVHWSRVVKAEPQDRRDGDRVIYQFYGKDQEGYASSMIVAGESGRVIEFERKMPFEKAKAGLPEKVSTSLQALLAMNPDFKPDLVELIYRGQGVAVYGFQTKEAGSRRKYVYFDAQSGEALPLEPTR